MTSQQPPGVKSRPQPFDPATLARSVIALPLLEQIDAELAFTALVEKDHPHLHDEHNAAIFLRPDYPGGYSAALRAVLQRASDAASRVGAAEPRISKPDRSISTAVALAQIEGAVIRQLLRMDAADLTPAIERIWPERYEVIIDINLDFTPCKSPTDYSSPAVSEFQHPDQRRVAKSLIREYIAMAKNDAHVTDSDEGVEENKTEVSNQYVFARLEGKVIKALVEIDQREAVKQFNQATRATLEAARLTGSDTAGTTSAANKAQPKIQLSRFRTIHHIWPDFEIRNCITRSIRTVKVDAAQHSFTAMGDGITWAVMDTGIDGSHPHFALHSNIDPGSPYHADFTGSPGGAEPLLDVLGHGTHVAGIIAGEQSLQELKGPGSH